MQMIPAQNKTICKAKTLFYWSKTGAEHSSQRAASGRLLDVTGCNLEKMPGLARLLITLGLLLLLAGVVVYALGLLGISFGHLPGDFAWRRKNISIYFPLGTCILISVLFTLILYFLSRFHR